MARTPSKVAALLGLVLGLSLAPVAFADNIGPVKTRQHPVERFGEGDLGGGKLMIRGHCTILEGDSNPITTPCSDVLLKLFDRADKSQVTEDRTDKKGAFAFAVEKDHWYSIRANSGSYKVVGPKRMLKGGDTIDLRLKQR